MRSVKNGVVLLEVLVSLGLLVAGMAFVGYQINAALAIANATDIRTRSLLLVDTKMAELDAGVLRPSWIGDDLKGYFGIAYPGYSWRMRVKPAEIQDLYLVTLDIGFNQYQVQQQMENPELEIHIDDEGTQTLRTVYRLVPKPADVSIQRDFGFSSEELAELIAAASAAGDANVGSGSTAGGSLATSGGSSGGGTTLTGGGASQADLMAMLTKLIQAISSGGLDLNSINPRDLAQYLDADTLDSLGPLIDMYFGNGPDSSMLPGPLQNPMIRNLLQGGGRNQVRPGRGTSRSDARDERLGQDRNSDRTDGNNATDKPPRDSVNQGNQPQDPGNPAPGRRPGRKPPVRQPTK